MVIRPITCILPLVALVVLVGSRADAKPSFAQRVTPSTQRIGNWVAGQRVLWQARRVESKLKSLSTLQRKGGKGYLLVQSCPSATGEIKTDRIRRLNKRQDRLARLISSAQGRPGFSASKVGQRVNKRVGAVLRLADQLQLGIHSFEARGTGFIARTAAFLINAQVLANRDAKDGFYGSKADLVRAARSSN